jgi:gamma-glutamyltranspeptidase/glutathione hydrolase
MSVVPVSMGHKFAASSGHELATFAAFEVLDCGGNAIDAGVAGALALGVLYSDQVSIAGVAPMLIHLAETNETVTIAGVGGWPAALDAERFIERHNGEIPLGLARTVVPAAPDAFITALERWGTMSFTDVATRAMAYARDGFPRHGVMLDYISQYADDYRHFPENVAIWMPGDVIPEVGSKLVQSDLARTLAFLCAEEQAMGTDRKAGLAAVRRAFYQGDIAAQILAHQQANEGILSAADLANFACQVLPSLAREYRLGNESVAIHTCGAWCQGPTLHAALGILETLNVTAMDPFGPDALHTIAETLKLAFADREGYLGDPDFVSVPVEAWMSDYYAREQALRIDPATATPGMPEPGRIAGFDAFRSPVVHDHAPLRLPADTSIVTAVDAAGNAFVCTPSDTSWDTPVVPGTGLAVSSRGAQSWAVHGHPSVLAPGKRPRLTPNPCFAMGGANWVMPFGTPGGDTQVQANLQFLLRHLGFGMPLQDAIEAPRLMTHSHPDSFSPHQSKPGRVTVEGRINSQTTDELQARGHDVERITDWTHATGGICAIRRVTETGELRAGADPRRMSRAQAW